MPTDAQIEAAAQAMTRWLNASPHTETLQRWSTARARALARVALQTAEQYDIRKVVAHRSAGRRIENAKAAFERRFGKSIMPISATRFQDQEGRECVKLLDTETGTWAEYTICNRRVKLLREHEEHH
jgi:hypothetical protein